VGGRLAKQHGPAGSSALPSDNHAGLRIQIRPVVLWPTLSRSTAVLLGEGA